MQVFTSSTAFRHWFHSVAVLLVFLTIGFEFSAEAQCVRIKDRRRNNAWVFAPKKDFRCLTAGQSPITPFTITFEVPVSNVTINWGDTTAFYAGPITTATRIYKTVGVFNYTITEAGCTQQIKGIFVNDYNTSCPGVGWIAPANDSARCLPDSIRLTNLSPGMNGFTEWVINWGDQSKDTADYPSYSKQYKHKYKSGSKICNATITISYRNSCNIIPCGQALGATFGPYRFMERDSALLDNNTIYMCAPTEIIVKDVSKLNCKDTANRQVSWTALDGFNNPLPNPGNGIWRPRGPLKNQTLTIPVSMFSVVPPDSTFKLRMRLRNKCGEDTAELSVIMISPSMPSFSISNPGSCLGTPIQFVNHTPNPYGVVSYIWDFGDGTVDTTNVLNPEHIYTTGGNFNVTLKARTRGFGAQICVETVTLPLYIKPAVLPRIKVFPTREGCDSLTAVIKNVSLSPENATWKGWELGGQPVVTAGFNHFPGPVSSDLSQVKILNTNPGDSSSIVQFRQHGVYALRLKAQSTGCDEYFGEDTIKIHANATHRWSLSATNLCQGEPFMIRDSSRVMSTDPRGLAANYNFLEWKLQLGSDTTVVSQGPIITDFDSPGLTGRITNLAFRTAGTFWVKLSVKAGDGCWKTDSIQVTVKPSAQPKFGITRQNCDNSNLTLNNLTQASANRYVYKIYKGNGLVQGDLYASYSRTDHLDQPVFLPYAPPGDSTFYYIVLTAVTITNGDSCVITSVPQVVKISPTPVPGLAIQPSSDGCSPLNNVNILNTSVNLPQNSGVTFAWTLGSVGSYSGPNPPPVTFINTGDVNKRDTVRVCVQTTGCSYCAEKVVVTYPSPKAEIQIPDSICSGTSVNIAAETVGAVGYLWEFPNYDGSATGQTTFSKVFNNVADTARHYKVSLVVRSSADCPFRTEKILKVNPNPDFNFQTITTQDANCGPLHARFYYVAPKNTRTFQWALGNGDTLVTSTTDTIYKTYSNETAAPLQNQVTVKATSASGCTTTKTSSFTINPLVRARFKSSVDSGCTPLRVVFTDSSTIASNVRRWIVNGIALGGQTPQLEQVFTNNNLTDTVYVVKLAVRNDVGFNCVDTMVRKIKVYPKPRRNDLVVSPNQGCSPLKVSFKGNVENAVTYTWNFDDDTDTTLTGQLFSHTFYNNHPVQNRIFNVVRYSTSAKGCKDTTKTQVVAKPQTIANISAIQTSGCTPFTAQLSALNSVNATAYEWDFGDGSPTNTSASPSYTFVNNTDTTQQFSVRLIAKKLAANSCPDTATMVITVYPAPQANFSTNTNIGCGPLSIVLTNTSTGGQSSFWIMSSGGISDTLFPNAQGLHDTVVDNPNFANKTLRVDQTVISQYGCTDIYTQNIQIYPNLTAEFSVDSTGCQPHLVRFNNLSQNFLGSFNWTFGDGSASNERDPQHLYENYGANDTTYFVTLTAKSPVGNCIKTSTQKIRVFATPRANFRFLSDSSIQLPVNTVTIGNQTAYRPNWTYQWTFGDGTTDQNGDASFIHTYALGNEDFIDTNFVVKMVAVSPNGCTDTIRKIMVVKPGVPVANFEATPREGCQPLEVQLTSTSSFARRYEWSYVDKEGSPPITITDRNPLVFFESAGLKTVKLKIKGLGGQDSIEKVEYINVFDSPRSSFYTDPTPPRTVVAPEEPVIFTPYENRSDFNYTWFFGDGDSSNSRTAEHKYAHPGTYDIVLKVIGPNGCWSTDTMIAGAIARGEQIFVAPTAFTPNPNGSNGGIVGGDGDNDVFYPFTQGLSEITMQVFNRWGSPMFESRELNHGWDGYYRGKIAPADSYVYRIVAKFSNGESQTFIGDVTLLR